MQALKDLIEGGNYSIIAIWLLWKKSLLNIGRLNSFEEIILSFMLFWNCCPMFLNTNDFISNPFLLSIYILCPMSTFISILSKTSPFLNNTFTIIVHAHLPSFLRYDIFHLSSSKLFQSGCRCLASFSLSVVSSPKQAAAVFTPALLFLPIFYPLPRGPIFLDPIPPFL